MIIGVKSIEVTVEHELKVTLIHDDGKFIFVTLYDTNGKPIGAQQVGKDTREEVQIMSDESASALIERLTRIRSWYAH